MAIGGNNEFKITNVFKADGALKAELEGARAEIKKLTDDLETATSDFEYMSERVDVLTDQLEQLKVDSGVSALQAQINSLKASTSAAGEEFLSFLRTVQLVRKNNITGRYDKIIDIPDRDLILGWLNDVKSGALTVSQAIANVKAKFTALVTGATDAGAPVDSQMVQGILSGINQLSTMLSDVQTKISNIETNGVKAVGNIGGGDIPGILDHIQQAIASMSEEARAAYQPVTQLVAALNEYAGIDAMKIIGVSQTFKNMADIGDGSFSSKKIENIISLVTRLKSVVGSGLPTIQLDLTKLNELHVRKASLSNLAEFLPKIQKVNAAKLQELANVNLTNFNNVKVSKASLNAIADLSNYQDSLKLLKDTIDQVVTSINSLNSSMNGGGGGNGGGGNNGGNSPSEVDLLKRMADASTQSHKLLEGNIQSKDTAVYQQFSSTLAEIDTILEACHRDASQLPAALNGTSMEDAIAKIKSLLTQLSALRNELTFTGDTGTFSRRNINDTLNSMLTLRNRSGEYSGTAEYKELEAQIRLFGDAIQWCRTQGVSLNDAFKHFGTDGKSAIEAANTAMSSLKLKVTETAQGIQARSKTAAADLDAKWQSQGLTASNIKSLFGKASNNKELFGDFEAVQKQYEKVLKLHASLDKKNLDPARVKLVEDETRALRDLIQARLSEADAKKKQSAESRKQSSDEAKQQSLLKQGYTLLTRLKKEEASWTAARKGRSSGSYSDLQRYRQELETLLHTVESTNMPFEQFKAKFGEISRRASESESIIRGNGEATQTWADRIGGLASKFGSWFSITRVIMAAVRAVRKLITSAKEIDTALTQLKIVTNASNEEMEKFANTAIDLAHNLGKSVAELTKSIETFSRLGYSLTDAAELAKYATIMSNVAGVSTEEATTGITSIIKGYGKDVEDAEHVADILVEVGQKYAVSAAEMMEAYEKSGAALHATNTSLEKSAGLIAAANASVQDASVVGK